MRIRVIKIECLWDQQSNVWYVSESNLPGLAVEADTIEAMHQRLKVVVPDLLAAHYELAHKQRRSTHREIPTRVQFNDQMSIPCYA